MMLGTLNITSLTMTAALVWVLMIKGNWVGAFGWLLLGFMFLVNSHYESENIRLRQRLESREDRRP